MAQLRYDRLPNPALTQGVKLYIENRIEPGSFLCALMENDLKEACARADDVNRHMLFEIVNWFYNEAPSTCWGSREKVKRWLEDAAA